MKPLPPILAALVIIVFAYLGGTKALGAHHFWSTQVALIGAPIGAIAALLLFKAPRIPALIAFAILTGLSFAAAHWGKTEFAASYAENQLAGKFWYFGWISTAASATALIATIAGRSSSPSGH